MRHFISTPLLTLALIQAAEACHTAPQPAPKQGNGYKGKLKQAFPSPKERKRARR